MHNISLRFRDGLEEREAPTLQNSKIFEKKKETGKRVLLMRGDENQDLKSKRL